MDSVVDQIVESCRMPEGYLENLGVCLLHRIDAQMRFRSQFFVDVTLENLCSPVPCCDMRNSARLQIFWNARFYWNLRQQSVVLPGNTGRDVGEPRFEVWGEEKVKSSC